MVQTVITGVANILANIGTSQVIKNALKVLTPENLSKKEKVLTVVGTCALSAVASKAVGDYIEEEVGSAFNLIDKFSKNKDSNIIEDKDNEDD